MEIAAGRGQRGDPSISKWPEERRLRERFERGSKVFPAPRRAAQAFPKLALKRPQKLHLNRRDGGPRLAGA